MHDSGTAALRHDIAAKMTSISVSIVLHDNADVVESCLRAVARQTRRPDAVVVIDNASTDKSLDLARATTPDAQFHASPTNLGFAGGHNLAIRQAPADLQLVLNPDCQLAPSFVERAVATMDADQSAGSLSGRLLRFTGDSIDGQPEDEVAGDRLDSCGMVALRNRRVLDRGSGELAEGRHLDHEYVFGVSGAAAVYRRHMLEDIAYKGEFFDEMFFAYREDVDLAWRAQLRGWRCRYLPTALARHRRRVAPGRRSQLPGWINRMSLANRWRMIAKNETGLGWKSDWHSILGRDLATLGYCALREQRTLLAVGDVARDARRLADWRGHVARTRTADASEMLQWFGRRQAEPAPIFD
jgi:GT2 family glycosyltransferase